MLINDHHQKCYFITQQFKDTRKAVFTLHQPLCHYCNPYLEIFPIPYFFSYEKMFFSFQNNPKNLDLSYKINLDLWDCLGRVNLV